LAIHYCEQNLLRPNAGGRGDHVELPELSVDEKTIVSDCRRRHLLETSLGHGVRDEAAGDGEVQK
jgi:hypothetical protein